MFDITIDSLRFWKELVEARPELQTLHFYRYKRNGFLQDRLPVESYEYQLSRLADARSKQAQMPFWDALMLEAVGRQGLTETILNEASLHNPMHIERIPVHREAILKDGLEDFIQAANEKESTGILSEVVLRDGRLLHYPMLDMRAAADEPGFRATVAIAKYILPSGAVIMRSGKSFHIIGTQLVDKDELVHFLVRSLFFGPIVDRKYVAHHLLRGFCTLRVSANSSKQYPTVAAHINS
ncbi:hypothetical protein RY831_29400 [Noviherbaspirillum sp. CPCC 100848]|uniref:PAS domain-containing protein n=1 Tax=Noviherbaspirillum album TaxID=3080276 RepID=A0ABU6JHY1_9BURK|nr:hypothetical protein [Noviherbaspirillum sp. CPCC 100848]MEC4723277.1 hypothetical protein [Noviherbaspirillum sp. CPCC 100848]